MGAWYVAWAHFSPNGRLGVFIASPRLLTIGQKVAAFYRRAHRTVRCAPDSALFTVQCLSRQQSIVGSVGPCGASDSPVRPFERCDLLTVSDLLSVSNAFTS
jgi:hypothetical protein